LRQPVACKEIDAMTKTVRIGSGLGFYGDAWDPVAASIERGGVQYIASDHLAELTLAILQKDRQRDPSLGYARDVVPMLMRLWPPMRERGVRFVCNAGGLNPAGAAQALRVAFATRGWKARIAVVTGDDVLPVMSADPDHFPHLFSGAPLADVRDRLVFANAYLGASSTRCARAPTSSSPDGWPTRRCSSHRWCTSSAGRWRNRPRRPN
jgi:hypothetical protein